MRHGASIAGLVSGRPTAYEHVAAWVDVDSALRRRFRGGNGRLSVCATAVPTPARFSLPLPPVFDYPARIRGGRVCCPLSISGAVYGVDAYSVEIEVKAGHGDPKMLMIGPLGMVLKCNAHGMAA